MWACLHSIMCQRILSCCLFFRFSENKKRQQQQQQIVKNYKTYQQLSFLIELKSDCLDRAMTISSVRRVMMMAMR